MNIWLQVVTYPAYILACVLLGLAGRKRRGGFVGFLVMSFLLTPLVAMFILFVGAEKPDDEDDEL